MDAPLTEKPGDSFAQAETELSQSEILSEDAGPFLLSSSGVLLTFLLYTYFYLQTTIKQASALKVAYIFKVFWAQICLMVA